MHGEQITYPKYLVRPSDYTIFKLVSKKKGLYSFDRRVTSHRYKYDVLLSHDFFSCTEDELPLMNEKNREYLDYMMWYSRSDGHGGIKGGTRAEYLDYVERLKNFKKILENS